MKDNKITLLLVIILILLVVGIFIFTNDKKDKNIIKKDNLIINLVNKKEEEVTSYAKDNNLKLDIKYEYNDKYEKGKVISQSIKENTKIEDNMELNIVISLGKIDKEKLASDNINELGRVPIMMYHGIINKPNSETKYIGGNVDKDGYNRTAESFRKDLEFYYKNNYRMIRLEDYVNGKIDTEYGKSPLILTFDDGNANNIKVTGLDDKGNIIIDPNSAVGILEEFKHKYKDYNVTATFFVNEGMFNQPQYNTKILNWLVDNGYDIGNHTKGHVNFTKIDETKSEEVVGYIYNKLDEYIPGKYINILALPFGSPYNKEHKNYSHILKSNYNGKEYITESALRVGWEAEESPFNKKFDKTFLKRCRAYDNNGKDFDIEMNFRLLEKRRYISDGNINTIVTTSSNKDSVNIDTNLDIIYY